MPMLLCMTFPHRQDPITTNKHHSVNTLDIHFQMSGIWSVLKPKAETRLYPEKVWSVSKFIRGSTLKTAMVGRQIQGLPLDGALVQMHFSAKKPALQITKELLSLKEKIKGSDEEYYVSQTIVGRGTYLKRIDIKGRGRAGIHRKGHVMVSLCAQRYSMEDTIKKLLLKGL